METEYDVQRVCGLDKGGPGVRSVAYSEMTFTMVHERAESPAKQTGQVHSILYLTNRMRTTSAESELQEMNQSGWIPHDTLNAPMGSTGFEIRESRGQVCDSETCLC